MIDVLLGVSVAVNVLLLIRRPGRVTETVPDERPVVEEAKPVRTPKPFRARKAFREVRREFEDAHDPRRVSYERVERFAKQAKEKRDDRQIG